MIKLAADQYEELFIEKYYFLLAERKGYIILLNQLFPDYICSHNQIYSLQRSYISPRADVCYLSSLSFPPSPLPISPFSFSPFLPIPPIPLPISPSLPFPPPPPPLLLLFSIGSTPLLPLPLLSIIPSFHLPYFHEASFRFSFDLWIENNE